ncbi:MAG TPA: adenosylcobinamide-phosphate synthase CbiB, partial [Polyangia bacterium]|nr:adenosylcobinamide-phosphate synthase CbiB [Polyangia bacterium]
MHSVWTPSIVTLGLAVAIDLALGEPPNAVHPVSWMGRLIAWSVARAPRSGPLRQLAAGAAVALAVPALAVLGGWQLWRLLGPRPWLLLLISAWLLKTMLALRALGAAAGRVRRALAAGDLGGAREGLRSLCSRSPDDLDAGALAAATVESVAENLSDSFVAPIFYYVLLGLPGAIAYRAVNTLDAMIGYHGRYEYLGKAAARLDDLLNLLPARLTAALLLLAGALGGWPARRAWAIWRRDGSSTESPNAGRPMATMAGLLG